jgi:hypothetical protein
MNQNLFTYIKVGLVEFLIPVGWLSFVMSLSKKYHHHPHKERLLSPEHPVATAVLRDTIKGTHVISTASSFFRPNMKLSSPAPAQVPCIVSV